MQKKFYILFLIFLTAFPGYSKALFERGVVVSKNELASSVGANILKSGGNAIDAAVATAYALGVVEPWACGIGGGGFALVYLANKKQLHAIDFRERAPQNFSPNKDDFRDGPKAGGIPGTVAGLEYMRKKYGSQSRKVLMNGAISYAQDGYPVSKTIRRAITNRQTVLSSYSSSSQIFLPENNIPEVEQTLYNPDLADTLKEISENGESTFYRGTLAKKITGVLQASGGSIGLTDLSNYRVYEWKPLCGDYRGKYTVCSFPLPSSGGICILEALNILDNFDLPHLDYKSPERLHYVIEALRFSFADRASKLGDPRFNSIPVAQLTSQNYANAIAKRIQQSATAIPTDQVFLTTKEQPQTTHFTVVDKEGNVVALTFSLNGYFGSGFVIPETGIVLNNTLDDFSLPSAQPNQFGLVGNELNAPAPGKTPLSSMSPTIVFDKKQKPILALGSPGGPTIISAVLNTLLAFLDQHMTVKEAVAAGRVHHQWKPDHVYSEDWLVDEKTKALLSQKYKHVFPTTENSVWKQLFWTVQAVSLNWTEGKLEGASDPRAEQGVVYE